MDNKIYDRFRLVLSLIAVSPLLILAAVSVAIGYPLHRIKSAIFSKIRM